MYHTCVSVCTDQHAHMRTSATTISAAVTDCHTHILCCWTMLRCLASTAHWDFEICMDIFTLFVYTPLKHMPALRSANAHAGKASLPSATWSTSCCGSAPQARLLCPQPCGQQARPAVSSLRWEWVNEYETEETTVQFTDSGNDINYYNCTVYSMDNAFPMDTDVCVCVFQF